MSDSPEKPDINQIVDYFKNLQNQICNQLHKLDTSKFHEEIWQHQSGGGGITRVIEKGDIFEKGGVNFSYVHGNELPQSATSQRLGIEGKSFEAAGVSLVMHPLNPHIPTSHMNVRFIQVKQEIGSVIWWFGGGYDLTPYYGYDEDCVHWHQTAKSVCDHFDLSYYPKFKHQCDQYFFLKHRNEPRGIGGIFFDDFRSNGFPKAFEFIQSVGNSFTQAYLPIVEKRKNHAFTERQQAFQRYRRGRYVEFNLVYDRGTLFGLQSNGRTESILMSLPPKVEWIYNWSAEPGSDEEKLLQYYLVPRNWI